MEKIIKKYARFVAKRPKTVLLLVMAFTLVCIIGTTLVKTKGMSYRDMVPKEIEEIRAMDFINDEFGVSGESVTILVEINPEHPESNEPRDIRDPKVIEYMDILEQKIKKLQGVVSVSGFPDVVKEMNGGDLPKSREKIIELMNKEIVFNQSPNIPASLSQLSEGLEGIEEGLEKEEEIMKGVSSGLNASSFALTQIQYALSTAAEEMGQEQSLEQAAEIISLINQIESLVQQSNATSTEKTQIIGYLEALKQGLSGMINEMGEASEGLIQLSESLEETAFTLGNLSSGMKGMHNLSLLSANLTANLKEGIAGINSGLKGIIKYLEFYEAEHKEARPIKLNPFQYYVSNDYETALIKINLAEMSEEEKEELIRELKEIIWETEKPAGVKTGITGGPVVTEELKNQILPTMQRTSTLSLIGIFIIVCLLFLSLRYGFVSLLAITFGVIWVYGFMGLMEMPITSTMSGAISMIMGIGIDFGIQVVNRFKQEMGKHSPEKAIEITLSNIFFPMLITTLAALIGFRAMSLGKLTLLGDLGNMMSIGVLACFVAAITLVPGVLVISERMKTE